MLHAFERSTLAALWRTELALKEVNQSLLYTFMISCASIRLHTVCSTFCMQRRVYLCDFVQLFAIEAMNMTSSLPQIQRYAVELWAHVGGV